MPCAQENDIAHENLVFERGAEMPLGFRESFLDLSSYTRDGFDGRALEFGNFKGCGEHIPYERCVSKDLVGRAG